ncbi:MAG: heavy metal translocating P-type ATPase [Rhodothermales bacterium]|nr:heavy metal translocating P-type ATPase [Rhodothermales bacterium]
MEIASPNSLSTENVAADSAGPPLTCKHCGLALTKYPSEDFCCAGCAVAFDAIHLAGLDATYYTLRKLSDKATGVPARVSRIPELSRQQIISDRFIESTRLIDASHRQVCLAIDGLTCAACGWLAEQVITSRDGMWGASVNLPDSTVTFDFDPERASLGDLADSLARFGYGLHPRKDRPVGPTVQERRLLTKVGVSWAFAGNVMLLAFALYSGLTLESDPVYASAARWASFAIAAASVVYGGSVFFKTAWASLKGAVRNRTLRQLHIDTPISLGIIVGFAHSGWSTISGTGEVWFDSITVLIAALLTARWLQMRSQRTASQAASRLLDLVPSTARRIHADGTEEYVPSEELLPGDSLRVDPGEIVPVDGIVLSGQSSINNAVITGESTPVKCYPGDRLFAGATNQSTPVVLRSETSGKNTRVGQLLEWLDASDGHSARVVQAADRISGVFVITILLAAVATAVAGFFLFPMDAVHRIVALLVISCPCALGMATPLAIAVANGKAARRGIYVKDGSTVEALAGIDTVVFDKTGTLTEGDISIILMEGDTSILPQVARLEEHSNHPIANAFVNHVLHSPMPDIGDDGNVTDIEFFDGSGIRGTVAGIELIVGRPDWVARNSVVSDDMLRRTSDVAESGLTPVLIASNGGVVLLVGCGDAIRPNARREVRTLVDHGKRVVLLSGDHQAVVESVAESVGISRENAMGNVDPEGKLAFVESLLQNHRVIMVGDGVNDTTALRAADVGIAVGNENAPTLVASDIFVPASGGASIYPLILFGTRVLRLIRRNLGISLLYNIVAGTAAIMGFVTPLVAAIAMPLSSLFVVTTSLAVNPFGGEDQSSTN